MKRSILVFLMVFSLTFSFFSGEVSFAKGISESEIVTLSKCVDGDTATFMDKSGETFKTRFLAIDTPETVHPTKEVEAYGKDASSYTCSRLENAKEIKLEYDLGSTKVDKYGRRLAWIFVDGELLQEELIAHGYAKVAYLYGDYQYTERLQEKEALVKEQGLGIWSDESQESLKVEKKKDTENEKKSDSTLKKTSSKSKKKKKNFIEELIDYTLGSIFEYIDELLEKFVKLVEDML